MASMRHMPASEWQTFSLHSMDGLGGYLAIMVDITRKFTRKPEAIEKVRCTVDFCCHMLHCYRHTCE